MEFLNAYTFGFCEKRGFTEGSSWRHSLRLLRESTEPDGGTGRPPGCIPSSQERISPATAPGASRRIS